MAGTNISLFHVELAIRDVCGCLQNQQRSFRSGWRKMSEDDLWREMVACILGSRVRFDVACAAIDRMERAKLLLAPQGGIAQSTYEARVVRNLSGFDEQPETSLTSRYPFPIARASQLSSAAATLYKNGSTIQHVLRKSRNAREVRRFLAKSVSGIGPKQASLFLRNIGYAESIAVLDTHVLTYMQWAGLVECPKSSVGTIRQYEALEDIFINHSVTSGFEPDDFDVAVWVVVRLVKKEYALCH